MNEDNRFFKPSINMWKFTNKKKEEPNRGVITNKEKDKTIRESVKFFDWQLSFTKTCVQIAFIIFILANIYILIMMSINYYMNASIELLDTYINNVFQMFIDVIGGYIIKSATENSLKIVMSVFSDYVERKYKTPLVDKNGNDVYNSHIDEDYYNELLFKELTGANMADSTEEESDEDDGERFNTGVAVPDIPQDNKEEV